MKHPVFDRLGEVGRSLGPRAVAVLVIIVELSELRDGVLAFVGGCREVAAESAMSRSSVNDEIKKLRDAGVIERYSAGNTSMCVVRPATLGLDPGGITKEQTPS